MEDVLETGTQGCNRFVGGSWRSLGFGALLGCLLPSRSVTRRPLSRAWRKCGVDNLTFQECHKSHVHRLELQFAHGIGQAANAATLKLVIQLTPGMIGVVAQMLP